MSQRRMFSPEIVESEEFLDMPQSSQSLYFHLGMRADDDGFIQPKITMRITGSTADDLKVLLAKRFLLAFESGVVVIKHWLIHNMIRGDRYKETRFQDEKKSLKIKENKAYTELATKWQPNGNQMAPQVRLGKVRLGKVISVAEATETPIQEIVNHFFSLKGWDYKNPKYRKVYARFTRPAKDLLELMDGDAERGKSAITTIKNWADSQEIDWSMETVFKRFHDLDQLPQEKKKKPHYEGNPMYQKRGKWYVMMPDGRHLEFNDSEKKIVYA